MANTVFSSKEFKPEQLANFFRDIPNLEEKQKIIRNWQKAIENGKVQKSKEEQIKSEFLDKFFGEVLGYAYESHEAEWNLEKEFKSISDGKKPDAALGFFDQQGKQDVRCVIEVKGALVNLDKKQNRVDFSGSSIDQAFNYVPRMPGKCEWVIVTNMIEIRLYSRIDISRYETFLIQELLLPNNLQRFFFLFSHNQLFLERGQSRIDQLFANRQAEQKKIGAEFYNQYKDIRLILFTNLFKENPSIKPKDLFRGTQKLIDRLIFIGFVRDLRLVDNVLTELNQNISTSFRKDNQKAWGELKELFNALNEGYSERNIPPFNGELFKPDLLLDNLVVRDHQIMRLVKLVQDYDFQSQLDVNILGHIFEQSIADLPEILDEIQKKTPLELEELKPETVAVTKRKKDGIFYTPEYITQYMVKEAVGGWLEDRKQEVLESLKITELPEPEFADYATIKIINDAVQANEIVLLNLKFWRAYEEKLASIKVVDPACGSGAFLNQVFDFLFNEWAKVVRPELKRLTTPLEKQMLEISTVNEPLAFTYSGGEEWQLKKSIILNNIYGVDLNGESVEITKLSLWLKTANKTNSLAALYDNIKQGNSLIDDPAVAGDDAFDWHKAFPEIMKDGGFDVVVGNPPYVPAEEISRHNKEYFEKNYKSAFGRINVFPIFYEKGLLILKNGGHLCFITPYTILKNQYYKEARRIILKESTIQTLVDFKNYKVFEDAVVDSIILHLSKERQANGQVAIITNVEDFLTQKAKMIFVPQSSFMENEDLAFNYSNELNESKLYRDDLRIKDVIDFDQGIITGDNKRFITDKVGIKTKKVITGSDFNRYTDLVSKAYIIYDEASLHRARKREVFEAKEKVLLRQTGSYPICTIDSNQFYTLDTVHNGRIINNEFDIRFLLSILNSALLRYVYKQQINEEGKVFAQVKIIYIQELPVIRANKKTQKPFIDLAERMLTLNQSVSAQSQNFIELLKSNFIFEPTTKLKKWYELEFIDVLTELEKGGAKIPAKKQTEWLELFKQEKKKIKTTQQEIAKTDKEIDQLVYKLYNLTAEEIALVENS